MVGSLAGLLSSASTRARQFRTNSIFPANTGLFHRSGARTVTMSVNGLFGTAAFVYGRFCIRARMCARRDLCRIEFCFGAIFLRRP